MRSPCPACLAACLLSLGLSACRGPSRPDAMVAAAVERHEQRLAEQRRAESVRLLSTALASAGMELLDIVSVGPPPGAPALGPILVRNATPDAAAPNAAPQVSPPPPAPPTWLGLLPKENRWPQKSWATYDAEPLVAPDDSPDPFSGDSPRARTRPPLQLNLLRLNINGRPVSFGGSLKGKGVQFRATLRM